MADETPDREAALTALSLLVLSWTLERQDEPTPDEGTRVTVDDSLADRMRLVVTDLLEIAERRLGESLTAERIQSKFTSLIEGGCQQASDGEIGGAVWTIVIDNKAPCVARAGWPNHCFHRAYLPQAGRPGGPDGV